MRRVPARALSAMFVLTAALLVTPPTGPAAAEGRGPEVFYAQPTGGSVRFLWTQPVASTYDHMVIRQRRGDRPIRSPRQGTAVYRGRGTGWDHGAWRYFVAKGLQNGSMYSFGAFAYNRAGDVIWSGHWETRPNDTTGPLYPATLIQDHDFSGRRAVTVWWKNPSDRDLAKVVVSLQRAGEDDFSLKRSFRRVVPSDTRKTTFDGLGDGEAVFVKLEAFDEAGRSWDWTGVSLSTNTASRIRTWISDREVAFGRAVRIVGHLETDENGWIPVYERRVTLHRRPYGSTRWEYVAAARTPSALRDPSATGRVAFDVQPRANSEYQMRFAGGGSMNAARSPVNVVLVRPKVRAWPRTDTIQRGDAVRVRGTVTPARAGRVILQRRLPEGGWERVDARVLRSDGRFRLRHEPATSGLHSYRVKRVANRRFTTSFSKQFEVRVR